MSRTVSALPPRSDWPNWKVKQLPKDSVTSSFGTEYPERVGFHFAGGSVCFKSETNIWCSLYKSQNTWSRGQDIEVKVAPLTTTPNIWLTEYLIPISATLNLSPQGRNTFTKEHDHGSTEFEHEITTWIFWSFMPRNQQAGRRGLTYQL